MSTYTVTKAANASFIARAIARTVYAKEQSEGAGATVRRSIGTMSVRNFTPFLMLDHLTGLTQEAGFPDHPHRGQETITYVLKGAIDHEDFTGSSGTIRAGDLQFMTAGRGVVHAEMPNPDSKEPVVGLQLWVDLPKELKSCEPRYRDLRSAEIPVATPSDKVSIKVISGQSHGVESVQELAYTPVWMFDYTVQPGGSSDQQIPKDWNAFLYVLEGAVSVNDQKPTEQFNNVFFKKEGDGIHVSVPESAKSPARFLIVAGELQNQPIVQHGPFVETSKEKIYQAFMDYQTGSNGFERARHWQSEIGKRMP